MCRMGRSLPEVSCEVVFEPAEWKSAWRVVRRSHPPGQPPKLRDMVRLVAELGGYVNRSRKDEPGPQTVWLGLQRLHDITLCWQAFGPEAKADANICVEQQGVNAGAREKGRVRISPGTPTCRLPGTAGIAGTSGKASPVSAAVTAGMRRGGVLAVGPRCRGAAGYAALAAAPVATVGASRQREKAGRLAVSSNPRPLRRRSL